MRHFTFAVLLVLNAAWIQSITGAEDGKKLKVITTMPDFADMAREIGGARIEVESLTQGMEDIHAVPVRPSMVSKLARADVLIELGLFAEHAWLPAILETCHNPKIKEGALGHIVVSEGATPREVPSDLSRKEGELHSLGNPHLNVDPGMGTAMAKNIAKGLSSNAPQFQKEFEANLAKYLEKISAKEKEWQAAAEKLRGVKCVSYHRDMIYLAQYLGMQIVGEIEPKPGVPPSSSHTARLIEIMKAEGVKVVIREPQFSEKLPNDIGQKTGAKVAKVAVMVGGHPEAKTWIETVDSNIKAILEAAGENRRAMDKLFEILHPQFVLRNSVYASMLIGAVVPLAGIYLVLSRRSMLALALPEAGGLGVAGAAWLGALTGAPFLHEQTGALPFFFWALLGAMVAMGLTMGLLLLVQRHSATPEDAEGGASFALAFGLTLAIGASNLIPELGLLDLLKGEILAVSNALLASMAAGFAVILVVFFLLRHPFQFVLYDSGMAYATGLPSRRLVTLAMILICITIALGGLCAGPLVIFAFLIVPPITLLPFTRRMRDLCILAPLLGLTCGFWGFFASYVLEDWNLPTSAAQISFLGLGWSTSRLLLLAWKRPAIEH